jgi:hypothetical protein
MRICRAVLVLVPLAAAQPANATTVNLNASLTSSCTLTLSSSGTMTASSSGTVLGSEQSGGSAASMTLVAVGTLPTVSFAAPALSASPGGWSSVHTDEIKYSSTRGASQAYTSSASAFSETGLTDTFTVHGRVTSTEGFAAGNYTLTTVVTCS